MTGWEIAIVSLVGLIMFKFIFSAHDRIDALQIALDWERQKALDWERQRRGEDRSN